MKKTLKTASVLLIALMMTVMLFACGQKAAPEPTPAPAATEAPAATAAPAETPAATEAPAMGPLLTKIKQNGAIVMGTNAEYPPYEFHAPIDGKDTIVGFDISIAKAIADALGVELKIQDMAFDGLVADLAGGNIDFVLACMNPTDERKQSVDFTDVYYSSAQAVLVRAADASALSTIESLSGKKVGVQKGTLQEGIATTQVKGAEVLSLTKITALVLELTTKKVDAVILDKPVAEQFVAAQPELAISAIPIVDETGGIAVALPKGNDDLKEIINGVLKKLADDGSIQKYFAEASKIYSENSAE